MYKEGEVKHGEVVENLLKKEREESGDLFIGKKGGKWKKKYEELYEKVKDAEYMKEEVSRSFYNRELTKHFRKKMQRAQEKKVKSVVDEWRNKFETDKSKWSKEKQELEKEKTSLKKGFDMVVENLNFWKKKM